MQPIIALKPQLLTRSTPSDLIALNSSGIAAGQQFRAISNDNGGQGNDYYFDATGNVPANGGSVFRFADRPTGPGVLRILPKPFYTSSDFGCNGDGTTNVISNLQKGVTAAFEDGKGCFEIDPGIHAVDRASCIIVSAAPGGQFTVRGKKGVSILKAIGTNWPAPPTFPVVGLGMMATGDVTNGNDRYLTATGRTASVTGATFNLTVVGGAVTAAAVVSGGTNGKIGDTIFIFVPPATCNLKITSVAAYRGAITGVSITASSTNWGAPSNPVAMTSSSGQMSWDRILDPTTLGGDVFFCDLVFDGNWGGSLAGTNPILTGGTSNTYKGLQITGHGLAKVSGSIFRNFPNDGLSYQDVKRPVCIDNTFFNNGWTGVQTTSRNGSSCRGIYVTTNAQQLNSDNGLFANNRYICNGDVPLNQTFFTGLIEGNHIYDFGTLGIEGSGGASGTNTDFGGGNGVDASGELFSNNGGIIIPADVHYVGNVIDGARGISGAWTLVTPPNGSPFSGAPFSNIPYAIDGMSDTAGNQGKKTFHSNVIKNTIRRALYLTQGYDGSIEVADNEFYAVGRGFSGINGGPIFQMQGQREKFVRNRVHGYTRGQGEISDQRLSSGSVIFLSNPIGGGSFAKIDISGNEFDAIAFVDLIQTQFFTFSGEYFKFCDNVVSNCWSALLVQCQQTGTNAVYFQLVDISRNRMLNIQNNPGSAFTTSNFNFAASGSGKFDCDMFRFDENSYTSNSVSQLDPYTPILNLDMPSLRPWGVVSISRNLSPGFIPYVIGGAQTEPGLLITDDNH